MTGGYHSPEVLAGEENPRPGPISEQKRELLRIYLKTTHVSPKDSGLGFEIVAELIQPPGYRWLRRAAPS